LFFYIHDPAYAKEAELFYSSIGNIFKKVKTRGIADQSSRKMKFLQQADYINTRYADFPIPGNIEICRDQVLIVAWEKPVITIFIHSKVVADHFRKYLNAVWKLAKP
jgi:hypothetical protein